MTSVSCFPSHLVLTIFYKYFSPKNAASVSDEGTVPSSHWAYLYFFPLTI